jgi:hypothetical protein
MRELFAVYHQWDEAAMKSLLARPLDPREQGELATYFELHGKCANVEAGRLTSPHAGTFVATCERGSLEMQLVTDGHGKINSFFGHSRGIAPPPVFANVARAVVGLQAKWDDRVHQRHFAKGPLSADRVKAMAAKLRDRHGACKLAEPIHEGFDWGYRLACAKEDVEMYLTTQPDDPSRVVGINVKPPRGAAKKCD